MSKDLLKPKKSKLAWRLLTIAIVIFFLAAGISFLLNSTRDSKRLEQNVLDQFGWATEYTPAADGTIPQLRIERFIRVREAVQPGCRAYRAILDDFIQLDAMEDNPDLSGREKATRGIDGFKSMFSVAPKMLAFMDARNTSLLAEEMGLGEYIYIYLAAYSEQLAKEPSSVYSETEESQISSRARNEFRQILNNQLNALQEEEQSAITETLIAVLRTEIEKMGDGSSASPWSNGPPDGTRESLAAYSEQVNELYCQGIVAIELLQKNKGFNFGG